MKFTRDKQLSKQIIILDGLTGTGKTMFSPLINSFDRVQNSRFEYMMEYLFITSKNDKVSEDASFSMLNLLADIKTYDGSISREVNFRPQDLSGILNSSKAVKYFKQLFLADGEEAAKRIIKEKPVLFFVTHQILSCIEPAINSFGNRLKIVEMVRHPLYLVDHWDSYIMMHGSNERDFTLWLEYEGESLPWFAVNWENQYKNASSFDRSIYSINSLMESVFKYAESNELNNSLTFIPFEKFVLEPMKYIYELETFLGLKSTKHTKSVLKSQRVPRPSINAGPQKNIYKRYGLKKYKKGVTHEDDYQIRLDSAKSKSTPEAFETLLNICNKYEKIFGLWF
jgi:hypothetical protein